MLHRFYNDLEAVCFAQNKTSIASSISENIKNSSKMTLTKVIEDSRGRSEIEVSIDKDQEKKKANLCGQTMVIWLFRSAIFL